MEPFEPLFPNPHLATIAGNFAHRRLDAERYPVEDVCFQTCADAKVLVRKQSPANPPLAHVVMVHGLEGSSEAGYMRSMAQLSLDDGFAVHRTNLRSCGGTESLASTMYHAGLTSDTLAYLRSIRADTDLPIFLIGYSLGGNVALKLAGELGSEATGLLSGVCAVSTPIDLGKSVRKMSNRENRVYEWRFLSRLKKRIQKRAESMPGHYDLRVLKQARTVYEFDDAITAKHFGFGTAENYYSTQSSIHYLPNIAIPTLLVQAKDDPLIPFSLFTSPEVTTNPNVQLVAPSHGGHLGFLSKRPPRFWLDRVVVKWLINTLQRHKAAETEN
ncbi:MAG TPA: alpha/beta fold hydrolase [Bryobacteraceae bacterium]|nr:alpha/beta fold hydrolase [Bryobacteraceae bacterium]